MEIQLNPIASLRSCETELCEARDELDRLTADLARKDVELEAWRSGRLKHFAGGYSIHISGNEWEWFPQLDDAVDALMAEEVTP